MPNAQIDFIITRAKNILTTPQTEWDKIDGEKPSIKDLYQNYAAILAAFPMIAQILRAVMHGWFGASLIYPIVAYILGLAGIALIATVVDFMAPKFGGQSNQINAFKLAVYSSTASWVAGSFVFIPVIGPILSIAGVYSLYLFYLGVPKLMKTPQSQAGIFTVVVLVLAAVIGACLSMLVYR